jgi:5'-nucleotidase
VANVAFSNGGGIRTSIDGPAGGAPNADISEKQTFDVLPFDNVIVTVPNLPAARLKELMEWGVARLPTADGRFPQISGFKIAVDTTKTAQVQDTAGNVTTPGQRITSITLDDGTPLVTAGAVVPGAPSVNLATTNFTAGGGDNYPFRGIAYQFAHVPGQGTLYPYQASLFDFITASVADGGLARQVTAARYPNGGSGRIVITP